MTRVLVMGGGLAGLSAAIELAEKGFTVTVMEALHAGGKLRGWRDEHGHTLETGMHFWWGHYVNFFDLLHRTNLFDRLEPIHPTFVLARSEGQWSRISGHVSGPLGPAQMILGWEHLSFRDRLAGMWAIVQLLMAATRDDGTDLDQISFRHWAREQKIDSRILRQFLEPLVTANFYLPASRVSTEAVLSACASYLSKHATPLYCLRGNATELLINPMVGFMRTLGVNLLEGHSAVELQTVGEHITGVVVSDRGGHESTLEADYYVSALNVTAFKKTLVKSLKAEWFSAACEQLDEVPLITTRIWWDQPTGLDKLVCGHFVEARVLRTFFVLSQLQEEFRAGPHEVWEVQTGPVAEYLNLPDAELWQLIRDDLLATFPELGKVGVTKWRLQKLCAGFTSYRAGAAKYRPSVETPYRNLFLAGEWLHTERPVFGMEKAVMTGRLAANAVIVAARGTPVPVLSAPLQFGPLNISFRNRRRRPEQPVPVHWAAAGRNEPGVKDGG